MKKDFIVAKEIDASLSSHPTMEYKVIHLNFLSEIKLNFLYFTKVTRIEINSRNSIEVIRNMSPNNDIADPRIRRLFGMIPLHEKRPLITTTEEPYRKLDHHDDEISIDPRMQRSVFKEKFRAVDLFDQQTTTLNIQCMLQNSIWYRDLGSNQKIEVNQQLAQLSNELKRFNEDPMPGKIFNSPFFARSLLLQQLFNDLQIAIDVNGKFVQLSAATSAAMNRDDQLARFMGPGVSNVGSMFGMDNDIMTLNNPTNLTSITRTIYNANAMNAVNAANVGNVANVIQPAAIIPPTAPVLLNVLGNQGFFIDQMRNLSQVAYQLNGGNFMVPNMFASMNLNTFNVGNNAPASTEPNAGNDNSKQNQTNDLNNKTDSNQSKKWNNNNNNQQSNEDDDQQSGGRSFGDKRNQRNPFKPAWQSRQGGNNNSWNKNGNSQNWNDDSQQDQQSNSWNSGRNKKPNWKDDSQQDQQSNTGWNSGRNNKPNWNNKPKFRDWDNAKNNNSFNNVGTPAGDTPIDWGQLRSNKSAKNSIDTNKKEETNNSTWDSPVKESRTVVSHIKDWDDPPDDSPKRRITDWDNPKKSHNSNDDNKVDDAPTDDVQPSTSAAAYSPLPVPLKPMDEIECEENWDDE